MLSIVLALLVLFGCLGSIWAIFHVKKNKKSKKNSKVKEQPKVEENKVEKDEEKKEEPKPEIKEDIQLTSSPKMKVVKSATLQPKIERVYTPVPEREEEQGEPVAVLTGSKAKPKKVVRGDGAKSIERVFSGKQDTEKEVEEESQEEVVSTEPKRTPSIADRIEFREHLAEIYGGFSTGMVSGQKASEIDRIQTEEAESDSEKLGFSDYSHSSIFGSMFGEREEPKKQETKKINLKDAIIADAILKRPKLSKNLKNFNKK